MAGESAVDKAKRWEAVRPDFESGVLSLRQISATHSSDEWSFSAQALHQHAKDHGWSRNLADQIHRRADAKVQKQIAQEQTNLVAVTEHQLIEANAERIAMVRSGHRRIVGRLMAITEKMLQQLERLPDDKLLAHWKISKSVADQLRQAVDIENAAYNITKNALPEKPPSLDDDQAIDIRELAREMAFLLSTAVIHKARANA